MHNPALPFENKVLLFSTVQESLPFRWTALLKFLAIESDNGN